MLRYFLWIRRIAVFIQFFAQSHEALIQIELMADGDDGVAENQFFVRHIGAHIVQRVLNAEYILQDIFKFIAEVIIGLLWGVDLFLHLEEHADIIQRQHAFCKSGEHQVGDLISEILLLNGVCNQPFLYIVADHRACDAEVVEGFQILFNVFCCLFQIKTHVRNLVIARKMITNDGVFDAFFVFFFHSFIVARKFTKVKGKR